MIPGLPRRRRFDEAERRRWISMGAVLMGTFLISLDQSVVTVALPQMGIELHDVARIDWVVTVYLLALGIVQPASGWLADRLGRKRVFLASLAVFTAGSALCAFAPSLPALIVARIIQGVGGGAIFPIGMAIVYEQFPAQRRGTAMGIWSFGIQLAPALGPTVGGLVVTQLDWRWLFLVNVPVGIAGIIVGMRALRTIDYSRRWPLDVASLAFVSLGLGAVLLGLSEANSWGWTAPPTLGLFAIGLVLLALWTRRELASREPLIDVRMFLIPTFSLSMAIVAGMVIVQFGRLVFVPLELVTLHGMNAFEVGLILTPAALGSAICSPFAGQVADRIGSRLPVMVGLTLVAIGSFFLANVHGDTPPWTLGIWITLQGMGSGLALTPNTVAGMNTLPQRLLARGAAVRSTTRQVAASFGVAALTALVLFHSGQLVPGAAIGATVLQEAYNSVFVASAWIIAACMVLALFLPNAERTREFQAARNEEYRTLTSAEPQPSPKTNS